MPKRKIVDEGEVVRWFEEGWTYQQMIDEYRRKYGIETVSSMWGNFRYRKGLSRRIARDDDLIPWAVKPEHRHQYPLAMLRVEGRRRAGMDLDGNAARRLESWTRTLAEENAVVHYDPDTEEGFFYVPREPQDDDLIRRPRRKTTLRRNADERRDT
ncbi:hypothetical protein [Streptomyces sp. MA15]|uniref:hypothetical protein n=1 Tax=unclassified Streptomyces TaxID=2593676 RepID=UPI0025B1DF12|nr:hypothetical protein [Streptomyces sp. MA15]MDN3268279.1 hypothetical protein [Streptomyces sp. MA15]